jgi:GTP pyrophosphokinase
LHSRDPEREEQLPTSVTHTTSARRGRGGAGVHVEGLDDVMVRLSRCCTPVPGDEIIGFVTRGRGVSVHRADCANAVSLQAGQKDRLMEVEWDEDLSSGSFVASMEVRALDRPGLLGDVSGALAEHKVNIISCNMKADRDRMALMRFECELGDPSHLDAVLGRIRAIDGVYQTYRVLPGSGSN